MCDEVLMSDELQMSDKLQFVVTSREKSMTETGDKLKFIGQRKTRHERSLRKPGDSFAIAL